MRAALASRGPHCIAAAAVDQARRGGARDRADSAIAQDVQLAEPDRCRGPFVQDARRAQCSGVHFFGYFLWASKESNPLAEGEWKPFLLNAQKKK
jgi:hypothetical protein